LHVVAAELIEGLAKKDLILKTVFLANVTSWKNEVHQVHVNSAGTFICMW